MYNKSTCLQELNQIVKNCSSCEHGNDSYISIAANVDLEAKDTIAQLIKAGISSSSQTCVSHLLPFICLYLFPLCGANVTVGREQCLLIRTGVCKDEWQMALSIPTLKNQIPNCESLPITDKGLLFICRMSFSCSLLFRCDPFI